MTRYRRIWTLLAAAMLLTAAIGATMPSHAQDSTPPTDEPGIQTTRTTRDVSTATPDPTLAQVDDPAADQDQPADTSDDPAATTPPGEPEGDIVPGQELVIAQGLAVYEFDAGKWWLTEIDPLAPADAESTVAPAFGFLLQIEGTTIIRNDLTGKRARIEAGEAYYYSAGDPYTRYADGSGSRAWLLEIVDADSKTSDAAGDVRYDSSEGGEPFDDLPNAVRDFEFSAGTLVQGESVDIEVGDAPTLVVLVAGRLTISDGRPLNSPAAFAFADAVTLTNDEDVDAQYYVATLSSDVISDEAPAAVDPVTTAGTPTAVDDPNTTTDGETTDGETSGDADTNGGWLIENDGTDTDGDTIPDDVEVAIGTDPNNPDTDGDFLKDWEELNFTSPLFADSDGDGWDDYAEAITYGTDPNDPNDYPAG